MVRYVCFLVFQRSGTFSSWALACRHIATLSGAGSKLGLAEMKFSLTTIVSAHPYIHFMTTKKRRRSLKVLACPECGQVGTLRKILYGMPGSDFDHSKYIVGGCVISDSDPEIGCSRCEWYGFRKDLKEK